MLVERNALNEEKYLEELIESNEEAKKENELFWMEIQFKKEIYRYG